MSLGLRYSTLSGPRAFVGTRLTKRRARDSRTSFKLEQFLENSARSSKISAEVVEKPREAQPSHAPVEEAKAKQPKSRQK